MENLLVKDHKTLEVLDHVTQKVEQLGFDENVCCFVTDSGQLKIVDIYRTCIEVDISKELRDKVVNICFLNIWNVVFIATETNLIVYDVANAKFSSNKFLKQNAKIIQASWNPTQSFLVVIDDAGILSGYSFKLDLDDPYIHQFIPLIDGLLEDNVPNSVYVGWGAYNTQFKGSKKQEEIIKEIPLEYSCPVISWRGNGEMFVINYWKDNRRFLKVFDATLHPLFGSEPVNNLLAPTSFKGQGNFIACAATDGETNRIVIFEKNCLVKSSFQIPENRGKIIGVQYHPEKPLLAVHSQSSNENCLNIYFYANATWYLKQQLYYPINGSENLLKFNWSNDTSASTCRLNVLTSRAIHMIEFTIEIYGVLYDLLAVINGSEVSFTEFLREIVPPPMASKTLKFERPVNSIFFYSPENVYEFCLSNNKSVYYKYENCAFMTYSDGLSMNKGSASNNTTSSFEKTINGICHSIVLSKEQDLVVDGKVVFNNVLSVHVHEQYLLFTYVILDSYKLCTVRLTPEFVSNLNSRIFYSREVEQGAKIVCVTNKNQVILCLPRGNLETITCRLIAIDAIEQLLIQNQWRSAINEIRSQKLNWNLLIDLNKERFVAHIKDFIEAATTVSLLNTIVTEFSTESCLQTMYKYWSRHESSVEQCLLETGDSETSKIIIIGEILKILVQLNPVLNLLSIVNLQIKHFSIRAALKSIMQILELNQVDVCKKAVAQLLLYKHTKSVICAAYTLYNINFLSFVYSCCSEDPRVFTPEIEELKNLNPVELRYTMNVRAKEFEKATKYLVRLETKDEQFISSFIKKYGTFRIAYNNVQPGDPYFQLISTIYADYLALKTNYNEAGLILERAELYEDALTRYKFARNWRKVITLLSVLNIQGDSKLQVLRSLAQDLISHKQIEEGALIYEHYCGDYKAAVDAFTEHKMFQKALCLARQYNSKELLDNLIYPGIEKYRKDVNDRISDLNIKFTEYTKRLLQLRKEKCKKFLRRQTIIGGNMDSENDGADFENDSANSEYGSIISRSSMGSLSSGGSKSSSVSSRNRRKLERKKTDLREGGTFEDIALIRQLYLLAVDIFSVGQEVTEICHSLTDEVNFKFGKRLQCFLADIQRKVKTDIPLIWSDTFICSDVSNNPTALAIIENRHELDEKFRTPPPPEVLKDIRYPF